MDGHQANVAEQAARTSSLSVRPAAIRLWLRDLAPRADPAALAASARAARALRKPEAVD
jgi:hypothetical protein